MSEVKHTPGPWVVDGDLNIYAGDPNIGLRRDVADTFGMGGFGSVEANARLIAAAPELLEAAQKALRIAEEWIEIEVERPDALESHLRELDSVRAAIAKARGEA